MEGSETKVNKRTSEYNNHINLGLPVLHYIKNYKHGDGNKFNTVTVCTSGNYCMQIKVTLILKLLIKNFCWPHHTQ